MTGTLVEGVPFQAVDIIHEGDAISLQIDFQVTGNALILAPFAAAGWAFIVKVYFEKMGPGVDPATITSVLPTALVAAAANAYSIVVPIGANFGVGTEGAYKLTSSVKLVDAPAAPTFTAWHAIEEMGVIEVSAT
ncbi:MAG: hypothetical protein IPK76_02635 [Lewinellaceae bacterium]|nr:hypothetical protein [Lewinellaceae bacterium]